MVSFIKMNLIKLILFIFLIYYMEVSQSIGVDYLESGDYEEAETMINQTTDRIENLRRINDDKSSVNNTHSRKYDEISYIAGEEIRNLSKFKIPGKDILGFNFENIQNTHDKNTMTRLGSITKTVKTNENNDPNITALFTLPGNDTNVTEAEKVKPIFPQIVSEDDSKPQKLLIDFYNLVPATSLNNNDDVFVPVSYLNENIWYVPENRPCWELPILYGELGKSMLTTDVFLMFPGTLTNVIETKEYNFKPPTPHIFPIFQTMNKWCAAGPCYGDHTLCLFPDKSNSKLCKPGYVVSTPTMVEQIGLVNTVNSIRNRIAIGGTELYKHLPKAAAMNQLIYDFDLESMAESWLHQCIPGPAACSALDENFVVQLECTKYAKHCCIDSFKSEKASTCIPKYECYVDPFIGCIHLWYWSAGQKLTRTDVECGHITAATYSTAQLIWSETNKIGCAHGKNKEGDVRVVCNFAPGAPFHLDHGYYCGFIAHKPLFTNFFDNITDDQILKALGIDLTPLKNYGYVDTEVTKHHVNYSMSFSDTDILAKIYKRKWLRENLNLTSNETIGLVSQLVTKYNFIESGGGLQCDINEPIYESGEPGSKCSERGRRFHALCYDFVEPTPGYRLVAVLAPVALFSLILYDLFSGVVRQTNF